MTCQIVFRSQNSAFRMGKNSPGQSRAESDNRESRDLRSPRWARAGGWQSYAGSSGPGGSNPFGSARLTVPKTALARLRPHQFLNNEAMKARNERTGENGAKRGEVHRGSAEAVRIYARKLSAFIALFHGLSDIIAHGRPVLSHFLAFYRSELFPSGPSGAWNQYGDMESEPRGHRGAEASFVWLVTISCDY